MEKILVLQMVLISLMANASEISCNQEITREPYCVSKASAKQFCSTIGKDPESLLKAKKCIVDLSKKGMPISSIGELCMAGRVTSSNPEENKSNCGQGKSGIPESTTSPATR